MKLTRVKGEGQSFVAGPARMALHRSIDFRDSGVPPTRDEVDIGAARARADSVTAPAPAMDPIRRLARSARARSLLVREGDPTAALLIVVEGWAAGYKTTRCGERQITEFLLPGDAVAPHFEADRGMDYSIAALTPVRFAAIDRLQFQRVTEALPSLMAGVLQQQAVRQALLREWLLNIGRRSATERIAYLMCEIFLRLRCRGLAESNACPFPLTQVDIADAVGLTPVHVNRMLKKMRGWGLISQDKGRLTIPDFGALKGTAAIDPHGLLLKRGPAAVPSPGRRKSA